MASWVAPWQYGAAPDCWVHKLRRQSSSHETTRGPTRSSGLPSTLKRQRTIVHLLYHRRGCGSNPANQPSGLPHMLRLVRRSALKRELEEVRDAKQAQEQADERGHGTTTLVVEETRPREPQRAP